MRSSSWRYESACPSVSIVTASTRNYKVCIVGASGKGNFGFRINVGDTSDVVGGAVRAGLTDAMGAEIHVVIADHGEIIPGEIADHLRNPGDSGCGGPCRRARSPA